MTKYYIVADGIPRREISEEQAHKCINSKRAIMERVKEETSIEVDSNGLGHIETIIEYELRYGV